MKFILTILFMTLFVNFSEGQNNVYNFNAADGTAKIRYDTTFAGWNARVLRRADQYYNTDSVEVLIDVCGLGEVGTDTGRLNDNGYGYWISNGRWDGQVTLDGKNYHPVIVVLQPSSAWPSETTTDSRIDAILGRWKIKKRAVHVSGLSMGGWTWTTYVTGDAGSPYTRAFKITSVVESGGVKPDDNSPYPNRFDNFSTYGARGTGGKLLSFEQRLDGRDALTRVNRMNTIESGSHYIQTNFGSEGHSNFNDHYNPSTTNWTTSYAEVTSTTPAGGISYSMAQWQLLQGDTTTNWLPGESVIANAGSDQTYAYNQAGDGVTFSVAAASSNSEGTVTYSWAAISGNPSSTTVTNPTDSATTITGANVSGYYQYELTVTADNGSDKDTVVIWLRDWMQKNVNPCREGTKQKFTITTAISGVDATSIYLPYITRDNKFGVTPLGGDSIVIPRNPNNGGVWEGITIGDFGGSQGCPVVVASDSITTFIDYFRAGTLDSNFVVHTKIDGLANRLTKGVVYGFQYEDQGVNNPDGIAFNANYTHHLEINGMSVINTGVGIFIKKNSDSTKVSTLYDNFRFQNININNIYLHRINGEGTYIGHTDIAGNLQAGNDGPTIAGDTLQMSYIIADSTFWDGLQTSNVAFGVTTMKHIVTNRTGTGDVGAQQFAGFLGGGTSNGSIDSSVFVNGTGAVGMLGKGTSYLRYCIIDSIYTSDNSADGVYASMSVGGLPTPLDSAINIIENNIISRPQRYAVNVANNSGANKGDTIRNNQFVHATKSVAQLINDVAAGYDTGNTVVTAMDLDTCSLSTMPAYRVYSELLRVQPSGTKISFFDLEEPEEPAQPPRGFKLRGIRLKLN